LQVTSTCRYEFGVPIFVADSASPSALPIIFYFKYILYNKRNKNMSKLLDISKLEKNSVASVRERTIPSDRRLLTKLVLTFANRGCPCSQRDGSLRPYSRLSRLEPLLLLSSNYSIVLTRLGGPRSRPTTPQKIW
jgi:hypothetical protein